MTEIFQFHHPQLLWLLLLIPIGVAINSTNDQTAAVITAAQTTP